MIVIKDEHAVDKTDDWTTIPFVHTAFAGGFDHLKMPNYIIGTPLEAKWKEVVKKGRYGEGFCARIDAGEYLANDPPIEYTWVTGYHNPGFFFDAHFIVGWAANTDFGPAGPNGYDCCLPWTTRAHIYQKPGSNWIINTHYHFFNNNTYSPYIGMVDGELRRWMTYSDLQTNTYTVLAVVPNTVNQWYDLELRHEPLVPLQPVENPTVNTGSGIQYRAITWKVIINGQVIYTVSDCYSNVFDHPTRLGWTNLWGNTECFIDNYYCVFMTDVGIRLLDNPRWVIRNDQPTRVDCRGEWTAYQEDTDGRLIDVEYGDYITFQDANRAMILDTSMQTEYEDTPPYRCTRGAYTRFKYDIPKPVGSVPIITFAVTMERFASNRTHFYGVWVMQPDRYGWSQRKSFAPKWGVSTSVQYANKDLHAETAHLLIPIGFKHDVYQKYLPEPSSKGFVDIGGDYVGAIWN